MRTMLMAMLLGSAGLALADEHPRLRGAETPRATDLLRAEKLAEQAKRRLRLPAKRGPGWLHGGSAWGEEAVSPPPDGPVVIQAPPPRRRARRD